MKCPKICLEEDENEQLKKENEKLKSDIAELRKALTIISDQRVNFFMECEKCVHKNTVNCADSVRCYSGFANKTLKEVECDG